MKEGFFSNILWLSLKRETGVKNHTNVFTSAHDKTEKASKVTM